MIYKNMVPLIWVGEVWPQNGQSLDDRVQGDRRLPVEKTTKRPKGRPPKLEKRHALLVRLPADVFESLRAAAFENRTSMTELVGVAVAEWVNRQRLG